MSVWSIDSAVAIRTVLGYRYEDERVEFEGMTYEDAVEHIKDLRANVPDRVYMMRRTA